VNWSSTSVKCYKKCYQVIVIECANQRGADDFRDIVWLAYIVIILQIRAVLLAR